MTVDTKELRAFAKHYQADTRHMIEDAAAELDALRAKVERLTANRAKAVTAGANLLTALGNAQAEIARLQRVVEAAKDEHLAVRRVVATVTPHYHDDDFDMTREHLSVLAKARDAYDATLAEDAGKEIK